ncbi:MAG TPA: deoxyribodipyrimidine photo-lyase [Bryobacteraceae bacterium]|nr:deoxyribodipyrimidine photo-lyase [Bryobacteraceae bacterium]
MIQERARQLNSAGIRAGADYVLYWSQMNRRADCNQALDFAVELANDLSLPVLFYEGLTCSYPYASDRFHTFILQGVPETEKRLRTRGIGYTFYLRRRPADRNDVLYRLAARAAAVVTDDYPAFVAARHNASVAPKLDVAFYAVDASCIVPMACFEKREYAAYTIRPKIHRLLPQYLWPLPPVEVRKPMRRVPREFHTRVTSGNIAALVKSCEIDHTVSPSPIAGGRAAAQRRLQEFVKHGLARYATEHNQPCAGATSGLSPYLHFGQIAALEVALAARKSSEFLEELIVRRELAFNFTRFEARFGSSEAQRGASGRAAIKDRNPQYRAARAAAFCAFSLNALPDWARDTMRRHRRDRRAPVYTPEQFERSETHDELWNAAQTELLVNGVIHGYYRMYWGKKIIEWSPTYDAALRTMIYLHDRYALDGRDPNTYTNILWCFGLHDRPWPERPVFGTLRWMSIEGMRRKTDVDSYLALWRPVR